MLATKLWGKDAEWIDGLGQFATIADCRCLTVSLWPTMEKALDAKATIDSLACGGRCAKNHKVIDLAKYTQKVKL